MSVARRQLCRKGKQLVYIYIEKRWSRFGRRRLPPAAYSDEGGESFRSVPIAFSPPFPYVRHLFAAHVLGRRYVLPYVKISWQLTVSSFFPEIWSSSCPPPTKPDNGEPAVFSVELGPSVTVSAPQPRFPVVVSVAHLWQTPEECSKMICDELRKGPMRQITVGLCSTPPFDSLLTKSGSYVDWTRPTSKRLWTNGAWTNYKRERGGRGG